MKNLFLFLLLFPAMTWAKVKTELVTYEHEGVKMQGQLAYDDKGAKIRPAILVFHDWMGNGPYTEMRIRQLAQMGYVAFAADIYGADVRPKSVEEASALATGYRENRKLLRARAQAGLDTLLKQKHVNKSKVAAIGYCFGGTAALELARSGAALSGVVSFHGGLATSMKADKMPAKILVLHGADDPYVPVQEVMEFQEEMRKAQADWQFISYSNAVHAFTQKDAGTDNKKGAAYNEAADKRSWEHMKIFFKEIF